MKPIYRKGGKVDFFFPETLIQDPKAATAGSK